MPAPAFLWLKRLLLLLLLVVLLLPALQSRFTLLKVADLGGYAEKAASPELTIAALRDNTYQPALERYVEDRLGFRELLIRLRNQLAYSLFDVAKANNVLVGEQGILFEEGGIRAHLGQTYTGPDKIRSDLRKLKAVQDTLAQRGVLLLFVVAPSKAEYYSDQIPGYFRRLPHTTTVYAEYARQLQQAQINHIDVARLFRQWKDTVSYPLFARGGIHWSGYGITLAADTIFRYIETNAHLDLPDFRTQGIDIVDGTHDTDDDIARALNLLEPQKPFRMAYPRIDFETPPPGQLRPRLLLIADSFGWGLIGFYPYMPRLFGDNFQFWYYNQAIAEGNPTEPGGPPVQIQLDRKAELLKQQVVLVLCTQPNLGSFDSNFCTTTYDLFFPPTAADQAQLTAIRQRLSQSGAVRDSLWKVAYATGRDYDALLQEMALHQYDLEKR